MFAKAVSRMVFLFLVTLASIPAYAALNVAVELSSSPAAPGELLMVRITVTNPGNSPANGVRLEMPYPVGLVSLTDEALSDAGDCTNTVGSSFTCDTGDVAFWNLGSLPAQTGRTVYLSPTISSTAANGASIMFAVTAFEGGIQRDQNNQTLTVETARALALDVRSLQHPVAPNSIAEFELAFGNRGVVASSNTTLRFPLPANTTLVSASNGGTQVGSDVVWDVGLLQAGENDRRRVSLQLGPGLAAGSILRTDAPNVSGEINFAIQTARAASAVRVETGPELDFAIVTSNDPVRTDEFMQTHLTVTNRSISPMTNVRVNLFYPEGLFSLSDVAQTDGGDCSEVVGSSFTCDSGDTVFWNLGTLPPRTGKTISLTPTSRDTNPDGRLIPLIGRAFADGVRDRWERRTLVVANDRVLSLAVNADQEPVAANSRIVYELPFSHRGSVATTNTTLRFPVPPNTTFVSATGGGTLVGNEVVWNIGLLNPGTHDRRRVTVQLASGAVVGTLIEVDTASIIGEANFIEQTARAASAVRVETGPELDFAIVTSNDPVRTDEFMQTHLTVTNRSISPMTNVRVNLFYPEGLFSLSDVAQTDGGDCSEVVGSSFTCDSGDTVFWNLGTLPPRTGKTISLTPTPRDTNPDGRLIPLIGRAFADGVRDRWERRTLVVANDRVLSLAVNADQEPVAANSRIVYELPFSHRGSVATTNTTLRFPVPPNTTFVSATGGGTLVGNEVVWNIGLLNPGTHDRRRVTVQLASGAVVGTLIEVDTASIIGEANFIEQTARAASAVRVETGPELDFAIVTSNDPVRTDEFMQTHLTVTNRSISPMTNVRVNLFYPEGLFSLSDVAQTDGGDCSEVVGSSFTCDSGDTVFWNLGTLPPRTGKTISLTPTPRDTNDSGRFIPLIARAFADSVRDRWERRTLVALNNRPLSLALDANGEPRVGGPDLTYTLTFGNRGTAGAENSVLRFPIPPGLTVLSADGGATIGANEVTWNIGLLGPGQGSRRNLVVRSSPALPAGTLIEVPDATLSSSTAPSVRAALAQRVKLNNELDFAALFSPNVLSQGGAFSVNLQLDNRSATEMTSVTPTLFYPNGLFATNVNTITNGGLCNDVHGGASTCDPGETVIWSLGNLASSTSRTVSISPTVRIGSGAPPNGTVIPFFARAQNASIDRAFLTRSIFVGIFISIPSDQPEIELRGNSQVIANGDNSPSTADGTDFGSVTVGQTMTRNFQIFNLGNLPLTLTGNPRVQLVGAGASQFTVQAQPGSPIAVSGSLSFDIRFSPSASGLQSAQVSIANDDSDENPTVFAIQGSGSGSAPDLIFRNGFEP